MPLLRRSPYSHLTACIQPRSVSTQALFRHAADSPSLQSSAARHRGAGGSDDRIELTGPARRIESTHRGLATEAGPRANCFRFAVRRYRRDYSTQVYVRRPGCCTSVALPGVSHSPQAEIRAFSTTTRSSNEKVDDDASNSSVQVKRGKRRYQFFTKSDDAEILRLRGEGYSWRKIADRLQRHKDSCESHYYNHLKYGDITPEATHRSNAAPARNSHKHYTPGEDRLIVELKGRGMRSGAIARRMGRSMHAVNQRYQYFIREGAAGEAFHALKARATDSLGRKRRKEFTKLEALTIVYLRGTLGLSWIEIVKHFPQRSANCLRNTWHRRMQPRYEKLVDSDPREWDHEKLNMVFAQGMAELTVSSGYRTT